MTIRKYFIYLTVVAALLTAWYYRDSIEDSIDKKVKNVRKGSPLTDYRIEGDIEHAMGR